MKIINRIISLIIIIAMTFSFNYSYAMYIVQPDNSNPKNRVVLTTEATNIKKGETAIIHVSVENETLSNGICEISYGVSRSNAFDGGSLKAGDDWQTDKWGSGFDEIKMSTKDKKMVESGTHVADIELQTSKNAGYTSYTISLYNIVISDGEHTINLEDASITFNIVNSEENTDIADETTPINEGVGLTLDKSIIKKGDTLKVSVSITEDAKNRIKDNDYRVTGEIRYADTLFNNLVGIKSSSWDGEINFYEGIQYPRIWTVV